jgi:hypothetical protein
MKASKKIQRKLDARIADFFKMMEGNPKIDTMAYRCPGSRKKS